jgi:hypothetical protein
MLDSAPFVTELAVNLPAQAESRTVLENYRAAGTTLRRHSLALLPRSRGAT